MKLSKFIAATLKDMEVAKLEGGVIDFDVAVYPDDTLAGGPGVYVAPKSANQGLSRIQFSVKQAAAPNKEDKNI